MPTPSEFEIQRAFVMWYVGVPGKIEPAALPGVVSWHTPNGGARSGVEAKRFKELGVLPGIPDYWFLWGRLYGMEFKEAGGRLSASQTALHPRLVAVGALIVTVDSLAAAKAQAAAWGLIRA